MELMRLAPMPPGGFSWENGFTGDLLKAGVALPALEGLFAGPWSPGTVTNLLLAECLLDKTVVGRPRPPWPRPWRKRPWARRGDHPGRGGRGNRCWSVNGRVSGGGGRRREA